LVEDSAGDVRLTREAFRDAKVHVNLHVTADGVQAMAYLACQGEYALAPDFDLKLTYPSKSAHECMSNSGTLAVQGQVSESSGFVERAMGIEPTAEEGCSCTCVPLTAVWLADNV
jgi:hypothetical protein